MQLQLLPFISLGVQALELSSLWEQDLTQNVRTGITEMEIQ